MSSQISQQVIFHYVKSNHFRVVHADGAYGGLSPNGDLFLAVYNERIPLPDVTVQGIENGALGPEIVEQRKSSQGIVRELEVGLVMDIGVAKSLVHWLQERIDLAEELKQTQQSEVKQ